MWPVSTANTRANLSTIGLLSLMVRRVSKLLKSRTLLLFDDQVVFVYDEDDSIESQYEYAPTEVLDNVTDGAFSLVAECCDLY